MWYTGLGALLCFAFYASTRNSKYIPEGWLYCATMGNPDGLRNIILIVGIICGLITIAMALS